MKKVIVRYTIKAGRGQENIDFVKAVFEELHSALPEQLRYATFVADDGVSFTHVASVETDDGSNPLAAIQAFKVFQAGIRDRCEIPPSATTVEIVGTYRFFD